VVRVDTLLDAEDNDGMPIQLTDLGSDDLLEISGERDADGVLHATRIERKGQGTNPSKPVAVEVEGKVTDLTPGRDQFTLGTLTVALAPGVTVDGVLADGVDVDVEGSLSGSVLTASHIEVKGSPVVNQQQNSRVEQSGFITATDRLASDDEIEVDGVVVRLTAATMILGDEDAQADRTDLRRNTEVEVTGTVDGGGVVVAERITLDG